MGRLRIILDPAVSVRILRDYHKNIAVRQIAKKEQLGIKVVRRLLKDNGLTIRPARVYLLHPELPAAKKSKIVNLYNDGHSISAIARSFKINNYRVKAILLQEGIRIRTAIESHYKMKSVNHDAFANANDNEAAAFFVGLLMADGNISDPNPNPRVSIGLHRDDLFIIKSLKRFLCSKSKICEGGAMRNGKRSQVSLTVTSRKICTDLLKYGVTVRKSCTAKVVGLENNRHFWRGIVDGDGSLGMYVQPGNNNLIPLLNVYGSKHIVSQFNEFTKSICFSSGSLYRDKRCVDSWRVKYSCHAAQAIIRHLYADCTIALPRKLKIAKQIMKHKCGTPRRHKVPNYRGNRNQTNLLGVGI